MAHYNVFIARFKFLCICSQFFAHLGLVDKHYDHSTDIFHIIFI